MNDEILQIKNSAETIKQLLDDCKSKDCPCSQTQQTLVAIEREIDVVLGSMDAIKKRHFNQIPNVDPATHHARCKVGTIESAANAIKHCLTLCKKGKISIVKDIKRVRLGGGSYTCAQVLVWFIKGHVDHILLILNDVSEDKS